MGQYMVAEELVDGIPAQHFLGGFPVINICKWIDAKFPEYWMGEYPEMYINDEELNRRLIVWMKEYNFHLYSAPRESFSFHESIDIAKSYGCIGVIVEDLS
jgi:hypothetical protein